MGFNGRKMEDERGRVAEKEAASRRATDAEVLEDAERLIAVWNERQALRAPMIFSPTIRRCHQGGLLVSVGKLSGLNDQRNQLANAGSRRRCGDKPHPRAIMPIMPPERAVRRTRAPIADGECLANDCD